MMEGEKSAKTVGHSDTWTVTKKKKKKKNTINKQLFLMILQISLQLVTVSTLSFMGNDVSLYTITLYGG